MRKRQKNIVNLRGMAFGLLTVIALDENNKLGTRWVCICRCGEQKSILACHLKAGKIRSCGCLKRTLIHRAGLRKDPLYQIWKNMKARCENPRNTNYHRYGGRGIKVCDRWQNLDNFIADMGPRPSTLTVERLDNSGNYEPSNCKWATKLEQSSNTRINRNILLSGLSLTLSEWARKIGVHKETLRYRLNKGYPPKIILRPFTQRPKDPNCCE